MSTCRTERAGAARGRTDGFSLIELLMVVAVGIILTGIAIPSLRMTDGVRVDNAAREIQQELQAARLRAVGVNRRLEVRFNCPAAGQYRVVESGWSDAGRCDPANYPYPAPADAAYRVPPLPRYDGPVRYLNDRLTVTTSSPDLVLQFGPDGRARKLVGGSPTLIGTESITVSIGQFTSTVDINGMGKARIR